MKSPKNLLIVLPVLALFLLISAGEGPYAQMSKESVTLQLASDVLTDSISFRTAGVPQSLLRNAAGVIVFPNVSEAELSPGGPPIQGVALLRDEDGNWGSPLFVRLGPGDSAHTTSGLAGDLLIVADSKETIEALYTAGLTLRSDEGIRAFRRTGISFSDASMEQMTVEVDGEANAGFYRGNPYGTNQAINSGAERGKQMTCLMARFSGTAQVC